MKNHLTVITPCDVDFHCDCKNNFSYPCDNVIALKLMPGVGLSHENRDRTRMVKQTFKWSKNICNVPFRSCPRTLGEYGFPLQKSIPIPRIWGQLLSQRERLKRHKSESINEFPLYLTGSLFAESEPVNQF